MNSHVFVTLTFCVLSSWKVISGSTYQETAKLIAKLLDGYHKNIRPLHDQRNSINITLKLFAIFLNDFDDIDGILSVMLAADLYWNDEFLRWNTSDYSETYVMINAEKIWIPYLAVSKAAESILFHEKELDIGHVKTIYTGDVRLRLISVTKTRCQPNMLYFPFDEHNCTVMFYPQNYGSFEVDFTKASTMYLELYVGNRRFNLKSYSTKVYIDDTSGISFVTFTLVLQQRPSFILLKFCAPIITLSFLSVFVFFLPVDSGTRISYSMTMFLSLAVFLTIVVDKYPTMILFQYSLMF